MNKQIIFALLIFLSLYTSAKAQEIPNNGFESWTTTSLKNPVGWGSLNWTAPMFGAPYTCTKTTDTVAGLYAMKLETILYGGDTIDGFAFTGTWPDPFNNPQFGYAYSKRPSKLTGHYKYSSPAGDSCLFVVFLTRWNSVLKKRDSIGNGFFYGKKNTSYNLFEVPIKYSGSGLPDTATVLVLASSLTSPERRGVPGNTLLVDELAYIFPSGVRELLITNNAFNIYPNPFSESFRIGMRDRLSEVHVKIVDAYGRAIYVKDYMDEDPLIDLSIFSNGIYILEINTNEMRGRVRLVKE